MDHRQQDLIHGSVQTLTAGRYFAKLRTWGWNRNQKRFRNGAIKGKLFGEALRSWCLVGMPEFETITGERC